MKRIIIIALVSIMAISLLVGCKTAVYKDGTYTAHSNAGDKGDYSAEVTIKGDKITAVKIQGYDALGLAKTEAYAWPQYHEALIELPKRFIAKNSSGVDTFTGATSTSKGANEAVARAMEMALVKPASAAKYFDGTFMAVSEADSKGGWTIVWVTIAADKITAVDFHSTAAVKDEAGVVIPGKFARKDVAVYGLPNYTGYAEAKVALPERFIAKNGADIDVYTTATGTSTQAKEAVTKALAIAARK